MKHLLILFCFLLPLLFRAQQSIGAGYKLKKNEELIGCYSACKDVFLHKQINGKEVLSRIEESGQEVVSVELEKRERKFRGKKATYKKLYWMSSGLVALYECKLGKENTLYVLAEQLDPVSLNGKDSLHIILALKNTNKYTVTLSEKGTKMLVHAHYQLYLEKNDRKIMHNDVAVADEQLNVVYAKSEAVPSGKGGENFQWEDNAVDEKGNVAILVLEERLSPQYGMVNKALIYTFTVGDERSKEIIPVIPDDKRISSAVELAAYPNGSWYIVGYYSEGFNGGAAGTWYLSPDVNKTEPVFNPFPISFVGENANDKYKLWLSQAEPRGKAPGIPDLVFKKVIPVTDGKLLLVAEQELMQHYTFYDKEANPDATWSNLFPNDPAQINIRQSHVAITCLNAQGKTEWNTWILKNQDEFVFGNTYCSYADFFANGKLHLFFNDHPFNTQSKADLKFAVTSPSWDTISVTTQIELNMDGSQTRKTLNAGEADVYLNLVPDLSKKSCPTDIPLLFRDRGSRYAIVRFK